MKATPLAAIALLAASPAAAEPRLEDLRFLEGAWRAPDGSFEEIWSGPAGGVMTAMARAADGDALRVLEYVVVTREGDAVVMRFKHFRADYSTWEEDGPVTLTLVSVGEGEAVFAADPPSETVRRLRYWTPAPGALQADVDLVEEDGAERSFSLEFARAD